ncbi:hypothetical protein DS884_17225 [Tenacibaculum sp. E3R01]|uniref:hypothetical protein n=1 Tax=Tenacibaculum sp. E3R01 TaxID=2267227 RepID=UPI000DE8DCD0|nr:hypothetical protein [Tenacibaculum sp. E3R01]RBW54691.1 hypothetical protein DS884_17225 [Tenacibaculum sp. E3R01]
MKKLSFNSFKERVNEVTTQELLNTISGGTENACHDKKTSTPLPPPPIIYSPQDGVLTPPIIIVK